MSPENSFDVIKHSSLPRDVYKWIQSLSLSTPIKNVKRDFCNGKLIAEIIHSYYPLDLFAYSLSNGLSYDSKARNWIEIREFFKKFKFDVPTHIIHGTIHCQNGAAELLIKFLYSALTNKKVDLKIPSKTNFIFDDQKYQKQLPLHAQATATMAIKTNIQLTEEEELNESELYQKINLILYNHYNHQCEERANNRKRFGIEKSLGEKAIRKPPGNDPLQADEHGNKFENIQHKRERNFSAVHRDCHRNDENYFEVHQNDRSLQMSIKANNNIHTIQTPTHSSK